ARRGGFKYLVKTVFLLLILQAAVLALLTPLAILIQLKGPGWDMLLLNPEAFIFAGFLFSFLIKAPGPGKIKSVPGLRSSIIFGLIAALCSMFLILRPQPGSTKGAILIYDKGYMNWRVPVYGFYGYKSGGMFGYLPRFLRASGFDVETVNRLDRENLSGADAVVVINVLEYFSDGEKEAVREFVHRGGGLLVLGDHTGVQGIRGPFNDLLAPYGIEFLFDSATFFTKGWGEEAVLMPHPVTHGLHSPYEMDIWVGASLAIRPPARPVVVAKYGYSDFGDITAIDHAYLGNRVFDPGEQLGDLVLVAANEYGKGRVLVFGDTSPFQNNAMVASHRFVSRVASWLVSGGSGGPARNIIFPIVIAITAIVVLVRKNALLAGVISIAVLLGSIAGLVPRRIDRVVELDMSTAVIDLSHFQRFDRLTWYDHCTGGLQYNLMRAGCFPLSCEEFSERQILRSGIVVIVAPVRSFSESEIEILERFMEKGGWILYTCG
ncbi:MAG: hypothetical protein KAX38_06480, partial [Candidatus Krumholzibacteria bacterium]|nr:hypothetical protein [Candidatus Krumholzibacteria bacterium]